MTSKLGRRAVVIGAGIAGLSAAGVLAKYFEQVDLLERDQTPVLAESRSGTPQSRHAHGLLAGGLRALGEIFPGFEDDLEDAGAVRVRMAQDVRYERPGFGVLPSRDFGFSILCASRPLVEFVIRRRTLAAGNIALWPSCRVFELRASANGTVDTVRCMMKSGPTATIKADLIVDASAKGTLTLALLQSLQLEPPPMSRIGVDVTYSTVAVPMPDHLSLDWKLARSLPEPPVDVLNAILVPVEERNWIVSVCHQGTEPSIENWQQFLDTLGRLKMPTLHDALAGARPPYAIRHFRFKESIWKHFETLPRLPRGLIPIGDAICQFNPTHGQGMSVAAQQARLLQSVLSNAMGLPDGIPSAQAAFMAGIDSIVSTPWNMMLNSDLAFPQTKGERPHDFSQSQKAEGGLFRAALHDPVVQKTLTEITHLLKPYNALRTPEMRERIAAASSEVS